MIQEIETHTHTHTHTHTPTPHPTMRQSYSRRSWARVCSEWEWYRSLFIWFTWKETYIIWKSPISCENNAPQPTTRQSYTWSGLGHVCSEWEEPCLTFKEPYLKSKEPYFKLKEPYISPIWDRKRPMGWLWLVGSFKLQVSFAKEPYKRNCILQKRPIILRSLLFFATSYLITHTHTPHMWSGI